MTRRTTLTATLCAAALAAVPAGARAQMETNPGTLTSTTPTTAGPATTTAAPGATATSPSATATAPPAATTAPTTAATAPTAPTTTAPTASTPTTSTQAVPPVTAAPPPPTTTAPAAQPASAAQTGQDRAAVIMLLVVGTLVALGLVLAALAWWQAWEPEWLARWRHAAGEAGWRAGNAWAEFTDWLRLGR